MRELRRAGEKEGDGVRLLTKLQPVLKTFEAHWNAKRCVFHFSCCIYEKKCFKMRALEETDQS